MAWFADDSTRAQLVPDVLARSHLTTADAQPVAAEHGWSISSASLALHDLACGSVVYDLQYGSRLDATDTAAYVASLERVTESLEPSVVRIAAQFAPHLWAAVGPLRVGGENGLLNQVSHTAPIPTATSLGSTRTVVISVDGPGERRLAEELAVEILPATYETCDVGSSRYYVGNLFTIGIVEGSKTRDSDALIRITELMHHLWTGTWLLDASLLRASAAARAKLRSATLKQLERLQDDLGELQQITGLIPSRVDTCLLNTTGREFAIWAALSRVWVFDMNLTAIHRKTEDLARVLESASLAARRNREQRLTAVLGVFTAVSVVASIVAILVFVFAETVFGRNAVLLRWVVVAATSILAVSWLVAVNRSSARPGRLTGHRER